MTTRERLTARALICYQGNPELAELLTRAAGRIERLETALRQFARVDAPHCFCDPRLPTRHWNYCIQAVAALEET